MIRRRIGSILLLAGSAALVWCITVLVGAALFNWYEGRRLDRIIEQRKAGIAPPPQHVAPQLHDVIGRLDIPRLHLSTIVREGDDDSALRLGAGHVPWTPLPDQFGNVGIAAHRDTFFRPLREIKPDDRITLTTPAGEYEYVVRSTEIVDPKDVGVLDASKAPELTLITCYPFHYIGPAPMRFIVHARRTS
jgi:sortase A